MKKFIYGCFWFVLICTSFLPFILYFLFFPFREFRDGLTRCFAFFYSRTAIFFTGSGYEVIGRENLPAGNFLAVANHQNVLDIPVVICAVPNKIGFIAKKELFRIPMLAMWMRILGCVSLDRSSSKKSTKAFEKGVRKLSRGYNLLVFPEGTRSRDGSIRRFKPGSVKMALVASVPIVPITCIGTANPFIPGNQIKVIVHPAIYPAGKSTREVSATAEDLVKSKFI